MNAISFRFVILGILGWASSLSAAGEALAQPAEQPERVLAQVSINHPDGIYRDGDLLRVEIRSQVAAHVYVLYHQANGETVMLFPSPFKRDNRAAAGKTLKPLDPSAGLDCRISAPFGKETLQVLVSKSPLNELENLIDPEAKTLAAVPTELINEWCASLHHQAEYQDDQFTLQTLPGDNKRRL